MPRKRSKMGYRGLSPVDRYPQLDWGSGGACPKCGSANTVAGADMTDRHWCGVCSHLWVKINEK